MRRLTFLALSFALCTACYAMQSAPPALAQRPEAGLLVPGRFIYGPIDQGFVNRFRAGSNMRLPLSVASGGGAPADALDVADIIWNRRVPLLV